MHPENDCNSIVCLRWNWHLNWAWTSNYPLSHLVKRITTLWAWFVHCSFEMYNVQCTHSYRYQFDIHILIESYTFEWKHFLTVNLVNFCWLFIPESRCRKFIPIAYNQWRIILFFSSHMCCVIDALHCIRPWNWHWFHFN